MLPQTDGTVVGCRSGTPHWPKPATFQQYLKSCIHVVKKYCKSILTQQKRWTVGRKKSAHMRYDVRCPWSKTMAIGDEDLCGSVANQKKSQHHDTFWKKKQKSGCMLSERPMVGSAGTVPGVVGLGPRGVVLGPHPTPGLEFLDLVKAPPPCAQDWGKRKKN